MREVRKFKGRNRARLRKVQAACKQIVDYNTDHPTVGLLTPQMVTDITQARADVEAQLAATIPVP